ncbi:thiamine phosphate synthase [Clostridium intestinale]|uniref:Thiamine-phosphate synthase n=1 Tax=Clostridium intestinale TaxID=36845 RepID=A0A7D6VPK5_9CLOT|nr:thiamine phosphate synthase [Clostridium intestinale]QLY78808.1 thiamine phosphate synthase [Clostridium intestinale]
MKNNIDYTLYLVTDRDVLKGRDLCKAIEESIKGGATLVQLREKNISSLDFYSLAEAVKKITNKYNVPLIINDRIDIALAVDAAGVHVGQSDIPAKVARKIIGEEKILGISAATLEEAKLAEAEGADYLGIGAVFPTDTKKDARSVSIELLGEIKKSLTVPVVGIGGINEDNAELLKESKIDGIAVVSAILGKENIEQAAKEMLAKFK